MTLGKERYNRQVQELLRGDQANYGLWGLAIDANLEAREQGRIALPFVVATVVLVLVVVAERPCASRREIAPPGADPDRRGRANLRSSRR